MNTLYLSGELERLRERVSAGSISGRDMYLYQCLLDLIEIVRQMERQR